MTALPLCFRVLVHHRFAGQSRPGDGDRVGIAAIGVAFILSVEASSSTSSGGARAAGSFSWAIHGAIHLPHGVSGGPPHRDDAGGRHLGQPPGPHLLAWAT